MAKRSNPFLEDFIQQSKVHIGDKQFNNNEERLKKVYEHTLDLLFRGAKKPLLEQTNNNIEEIHVSRRDKMKQLIISRNGALEQSSDTVPAAAAAGAARCAGCAGAAAGACAYCEGRLCARCRRECALCRAGYCARCSLLGSDGVEMCLSCYN